MTNTEILLDTFLESIKQIAKTVFLVGSRSTESHNPRSDIDLFIFAEGSESIVELRKKTKPFLVNKDRPFLDCKYFTEDSFRTSLNSNENFFLWSILQNRTILLGEDITIPIKLNIQRTIDFLWNCVSEVEDACSCFEDHLQFTGSCYKIFTAATTMYFAKMHFSDSKVGTKEEFLLSLLKQQYEITRNRYYWVARNNPENQPKVLRIPAKIDRIYKSQDYGRMLDIANGVHTKMKTELPRIIITIESL